jgi:hypothetical protein
MRSQVINLLRPQVRATGAMRQGQRAALQVLKAAV